jgi:uncharacterized SAM-binding protein YcdF (DUF218 family)
MFFVLSKLLFFLLMPFWWMMILLIMMWFSKSAGTKKKLLIAVIVIGIVFTNPWLYKTAVLAWQPEPVSLPAGKSYEAGIVLGGMAGHDKYDRGYFGDAADRFIQTANLYHRGIIKRILITGGLGTLSQDEPAEAGFLKTAFMENGVPDSSIIIETRSRNTYENAIYSKTLIDSMHLQPPFVLVTSALHMKRSEHVFRKAGYEFISFPCGYRVVPERFRLLNNIIPSVSLLDQWSFFLKEMVGLAVYKLTGKA